MKSEHELIKEHCIGTVCRSDEEKCDQYATVFLFYIYGRHY